jgi:hypothetical protein
VAVSAVVANDVGRESSCVFLCSVPREIIDEATGEMLDVVQDNDPGLPPEADPQEPEERDRPLDRFPARR